MSADEYRAWLDSVIKKKIQLDRLKKCENVALVTDVDMLNGWPEIHVHEGIEILADAIGAELVAEPFTARGYSVKKYFLYRGSKVYQLFEEVH